MVPKKPGAANLVAQEPGEARDLGAAGGPAAAGRAEPLPGEEAAAAVCASVGESVGFGVFCMVCRCVTWRN